MSTLCESHLFSLSNKHTCVCVCLGQNLWANGNLEEIARANPQNRSGVIKIECNTVNGPFLVQYRQPSHKNLVYDVYKSDFDKRKPKARTTISKTSGHTSTKAPSTPEPYDVYAKTQMFQVKPRPRSGIYEGARFDEHVSETPAPGEYKSATEIQSREIEFDWFRPSPALLVAPIDERLKVSSKCCL